MKWLGFPSHKVYVETSRPRDVLVSMVYNGEEILAYHAGPSVFELVTRWGVTPQAARTIWKKVCEKVSKIGHEYLDKVS